MGFTLWVLTQPGAPVLGMPAAALMLILLPAFYQPAPLQGGPACLACSASELHFEAKGGERGCQGFCEQGLSSIALEGASGGPGVGPGSPQLWWLDPKTNAGCSSKDSKGQGHLQPHLKLSPVWFEGNWGEHGLEMASPWLQLPPGDATAGSAHWLSERMAVPVAPQTEWTPKGPSCPGIRANQRNNEAPHRPAPDGK